MQSNKYLIDSFRSKIKDIKDRASLQSRELTKKETETCKYYDRYIEYATGSNQKITKGRVTDCFANNHPHYYWGTAPFIAHCLLKGNKDSYNALLSAMGFDFSLNQENNNNSNNSSNQRKRPSKNKKKKKPHRNLPRKPVLKEKKKKKSKAKIKLYTESSKAFAKFNKKYSKLPSVSTGRKTYLPRSSAIASNLNLCNPPDGLDIAECIDKMSIPMKENITAWYIDQQLRPKPLGYVTASEIKEFNPLIFNGCSVGNFTINRNATYWILSPKENNAHQFEIYKPFIKLINNWVEWENNKFHHDFFENEIDDILNGSDSESELESESESQLVEEEEVENQNQNENENEFENEYENGNENQNEKENENEDKNKKKINENLLTYLEQHDLNVPTVINALTNRPKPVKLSELAMIPDEELTQYMKNILQMDCIQRVRFRQMIKEYKEYYRQCLENL